jgi:hypothetical protein
MMAGKDHGRKVLPSADMEKTDVVQTGMRG